MSRQIQCPHCGQSYALTDEQAPKYAGQTITCTRCQQPIVVPADAAARKPVTVTITAPSPAKKESTSP